MSSQVGGCLDGISAIFTVVLVAYFLKKGSLLDALEPRGHFETGFLRCI